jgi:hypothetical protein
MIKTSEGGYETLHSPLASLNYSFDWNAWLDSGETVVVSNWASDSIDIVLTLQQNSAGVCSVYATGGVDGKVYKITNYITTSVNAKKDSRTITLVCKQR